MILAGGAQFGLFDIEAGQQLPGFADRRGFAVDVGLELAHPGLQLGESLLGPSFFAVEGLALDLQPVQDRRAGRFLLAQRLDQIGNLTLRARYGGLCLGKLADHTRRFEKRGLFARNLFGSGAPMQVMLNGFAAAQLGGDFLIALRLPGLLAQMSELGAKLSQYIAQALQIGLRLLQP